MMVDKQVDCEACGGAAPKVNTRTDPPRAVYKCEECDHLTERLTMW